MYRVLTCLTTQHDYRLLFLAIVVCVVESFVSFYVYWQVSENRGYLSKSWLAVAGLCMGGSIWATHFIAMLAYEGGVPVSYDPFLTLVSLLIAFALTTLGYFYAATLTSPRRIAMGGVIIGIGIATMHFTGMGALTIAGDIKWDWGLVFAAIVLGCLFPAAALLVFHRQPGIKTVLQGTLLMVGGIASLHFIAMAAVTIEPNPGMVVPVLRFAPATMALGIVMVTVLVLGAGFIASFQETRAARESAQGTRELVNASTDALVLARNGVIVDANRCAIELWGAGREDLIGRTVFGDLLLGDAPDTGEAGAYTLETYLKPADDDAIPVEILRQPLHAISHANEAYAIKDLRPLIQTTERLRRMNEALQTREKELQTQNMRFDTALNNMTQGLCMFDAEQRIVVSNRRYAELYGLSPDQMKPGTPLTAIIEMRIANGLYAGGSPDAYRSERIKSLETDLDMVQELSDGRSMAISLRLMPDGGYVSTHEDVTERRRIEARLKHMAHHDALTDLPNRTLLRQRLVEALQGARVDDGRLAVLMLDLDRFKEVNDTLGHQVGDALIKTVAHRLRGGLRHSATVARYGGDEFAVIESLGESDDPETLPRRIQELVNTPMELDGHIVSVGTTIGIAMAPRDGTDPDDLLKRADRALYRAKTGARGTYRFFEAEMDEGMQERRALENDLQQALAAGQLELYYQPLINLARDEITGFEALMRWKHPTRGFVPPSVFIPLAEDTGHITSLTEWVLNEACAEAAKWPASLKVAVNLSVPQFKARNLVPLVSGALAQARLEPQRLELEITETVMLNDAEGVFAIFGQLHQLGVRIVLDDFGTGFSSLSYLLRFPFDKIKIDKSFIHNLAEGGNSLVLVRSLIQMARGLGVQVTAEGIETKEQLDIVRAEGCTEIQGYYISRPRPASEIDPWHQHRWITKKAAVA